MTHLDAGDTRDVTVVLPCRDEAGSLPGVLAAVPRDYHVVVVDNGSTDDTAGVARRHGAVVVEETRPGYGSAVHAGIVAARAGVVGVLDADGSLDPAELPMMVRRHLGGVDLVVGRRRPVDRAAAPPPQARIGNWWVRTGLRRRYGLTVHDIGSMRVFDRDAVLRLRVTDRRFGYPVELLARAAAAGWRVEEVDVAYRSRTDGVSKVSGSWLGTLRTARDFARVLR